MRTGKIRLAFVAWTVLALSGLLSGCGGGGSGGSSYLAATDAGVIYIKWTNANGALAGSETTFTASTSDPNGGSASTLDFTGVLGGSSVTLTFPPTTGMMAWSGTIDGDNLHMKVINASGRISEVVFKRADDDQYSRAVAGFAAKAAAASASAAAQRSAAIASVAAAAKAYSDIADRLNATEAAWDAQPIELHTPDSLYAMKLQDWAALRSALVAIPWPDNVKPVADAVLSALTDLEQKSRAVGDAQLDPSGQLDEAYKAFDYAVRGLRAALYLPPNVTYKY